MDSNKVKFIEELFKWQDKKDKLLLPKLKLEKILFQAQPKDIVNNIIACRTGIDMCYILKGLIFIIYLTSTKFILCVSVSCCIMFSRQTNQYVEQ